MSQYECARSLIIHDCPQLGYLRFESTIKASSDIMSQAGISRHQSAGEDAVHRKLPMIKELIPGIYYWCTCGKTADGPFCDKSHGDGDRGPIEFRVRERKKLALCTCRRTKTAPLCDGSHVRG